MGSISNDSNLDHHWYSLVVGTFVSIPLEDGEQVYLWGSFDDCLMR